jgi:hypothetical protein
VCAHTPVQAKWETQDPEGQTDALKCAIEFVLPMGREKGYITENLKRSNVNYNST